MRLAVTVVPPCIARNGTAFSPCHSSPVVAEIVAKVGEGPLGRNNRIATSKSLNQPCVSWVDPESMLLPRTPKIFLQQYRPVSEARVAYALSAAHGGRRFAAREHEHCRPQYES